jgi:hypothetical protein
VRAPPSPGLGFPIARLVAVFGPHCAAVPGVAVGPYAGKGTGETGETALFRTLYDDPAPGDVVPADRIYASFRGPAVPPGRGAGGLMRQHHRRKYDFRGGGRSPAARAPGWATTTTCTTTTCTTTT